MRCVLLAYSTALLFVLSSAVIGQDLEYDVNSGVDYTDPLTSEYDPQEVKKGSHPISPYYISDIHLKEIRNYFLYPFYDKGGNADNEGDYQKAIQTSTPQVHKDLNFQLPFFGFRYNYTRVSLNGYLEFSDPPDNYEYPLVFPVKNWPKRNDPAFIGIFFSKCKIGKLRPDDVDKRKPGVYFRVEENLGSRTDRMGVEIRERLKWDIREGIIGADTFDPKHAIIVTWKNVSFGEGHEMAAYRTNTFQVVLATDEVFTYAMFNYLTLNWTSHTEAGSATATGEGGVPAFVGFNGGNGTRSYEYKPYSQASVIRDLTETGFGNNKKGRHIFRIDENILVGSCNKDIDGVNLPLVLAPESGNMLGGTVVNITGPCFEPDDQVICGFGSSDLVYGIVVSRNRAICVQPLLYVEGYITLSVTVASRYTRIWKAKYYVETPSTAAQKIYFTDMSYNERSPSEIAFTWQRFNLSTNDNSNVRISLWGYRETRFRPEIPYITDLADHVQNTGSFKITPSHYRNKENEFLTDLKFGFIQISLTGSNSVLSKNGKTKVKFTPLIWSRPIPLGWYFNPQWDRMYGFDWPQLFCKKYLEDDRKLTNFTHELPKCPCTLEQALANKGEFMPDFDCDKDSNPECFFHRGAVHCVRTGTPSLHGAEQQCCYDRNGYLMLSHDQQWASFPRRNHNLGHTPWQKSSNAPSLSQWHNDIVPRFLCCLWQEERSEGCEVLRHESRPTQDCRGYIAPGVACVFGDPHVITFNDLSYTFNGKGQFVLVRANGPPVGRLDVQGRFEQMPPSPFGEVMATQLTSVVARGNTSTVVEVKLRPREARWRYKLDVIVDGRRVYFDRPPLKFQHFLGVAVYTPTHVLNQSEVIIMFDSGAGVEVIENDGYMTARVYLPRTFINQTRGLFGSWSFDVLDELTLPDGTTVNRTVFPEPYDFERVYKDFGIKWMLDDVDDPLKGRSLFHAEYGRTAATYNEKTFKPEFLMRPEQLIPSNRSVERIVGYMICGGYEQCLYDYSVTGNRDLAKFDARYKESMIDLKETNRKYVVSCGILQTPRFGRKSTFMFVPGTKVLFECWPGFTLVGDPRRECLPNGQWNTPINGTTACIRSVGTS